MKIYAILLALLSHNALGGVEYYGAASTEAVLEYTSKIQINSDIRHATSQKSVIDEQISHLVGHLQSVSYRENGGYPGVLGDTYDVKILTSKILSAGIRELTYRFKGRINFHSRAFKNNATTSVKLKLPLNPHTIYSFGVVNETNKCTDDHYNSEGDFFYFWDPELKNCPMKGGKHPQIAYVLGKLTKLENTTKTYPEFDRLYLKDKLNISVMIGFINEVTRGRVRTSDEGYQTFKALKENLLSRGFKIGEEKKRFKLDGRGEGKNGNSYFTSLTRTITNGLGRNQEVEVRLLLSDTELTTRDRTFELYYVDALKNSDILAYDGHSGLGGNLDLGSLPKVKFNSNYQIYFLNGCSSYPYFNKMYFGAKIGGSKNLELITTGLPTLTSTSLVNMLAFINPFLEGKVQSYQTILNGLERSNGSEETYLMGVNGDQDNEFRP